MAEGFYAGRAIHIHVQVHTNWQLRHNGTILSSDIINTGQLYFAEDLSQHIMAHEPYVSRNGLRRVTNEEDGLFERSTAGGYNPILSIVPLDGEDASKGMVGYITMGVDTTAVQD